MMILGTCAPFLIEDVRGLCRSGAHAPASSDGAASDGPRAHAAAPRAPRGMGYHWPNQSLADPVFDPLQPEVLLYAPGANGKLGLVAVEYVVIDVGQPRPEFAGHPFDIGGVPPLMMLGIPHWSLHVWLYEENPSGVFIPFNPNVSCS